MSDAVVDSDSDAPEEFTSQQGMQKDEEIRGVIKENKARAVHERKERRRQWLQKLTPRTQPKTSSIEEQTESQMHEESQGNNGMLPDDIVKHLAAQEKKVFESDSEDEKVDDSKPTSKRRRIRKSGLEPIILKEMKTDQCVQSSLEFLRKRKMQVPRSSSVLRNSKRASGFGFGFII